MTTVKHSDMTVTFPDGRSGTGQGRTRPSRDHVWHGSVVGDLDAFAGYSGPATAVRTDGWWSETHVVSVVEDSQGETVVLLEGRGEWQRPEVQS